MKVYNRQEIEDKVATHGGWIFVNEAIEKQFEFKDFSAALGFIVRIGLLAEQADHHPDIRNVYNKVTIRLNTHSAHGITDKDFGLAEKIDSLN